MLFQLHNITEIFSFYFYEQVRKFNINPLYPRLYHENPYKMGPIVTFYLVNSKFNW